MTAKRRFSTMVLLLSAAASTSCTSFLFPQPGGGDAPAELLDVSQMALVPAGSFMMGWNNGDPDEFPAHEVQLDAFRIDRTELPNGNYKLCVDEEICRPAQFATDPVLGRARHPAVGVTWRDARKYCKWVGKRLPTEAEWEYAARAPGFSAYPWGGPFRDTLANSRGEVDGYEKTAPVGSFIEGRSKLEIYDMAGNVAEWTADAYDATYYKTSPKKNPNGPQIPTGTRVIRGGSWADNGYQVRSTARDSLDPNLARDSVGFRCVKSAEPGE